ncbi:MAG: hypothetical protein IBX44_02560 [Sulfurospirillum sp.]|nr:hypothetical protein [Sulfurospirillum sp.]
MDGLKLQKKIELNFKEGEKVKVSPIGNVIGYDGRGFVIDGEQLLRDIATNDIHIPLDINHSFAEAVGWFDKSSFEVREDGMYGSLELNQKGKELLEAKSYRYLSPVYSMGENSRVVGLDSVGLVNRPNLLNRELNEKEKTKKEKKLQELEALKNEIASLKTEVESLKKEPEAKEPEDKEENSKAIMNELSVLGAAIKEMNKKIGLLGGKTDLEQNNQTKILSANDKKVADLLGITPEEYLASKEA